MTVLDQIEAEIDLPDHEWQLVHSVRKLAEEKIRPRASDLDLRGEFPWDNVSDLNALGLNGMFIPEEYDGFNFSYLSYLLCVREISKACASTGIVFATNFHATSPLVDFCNDEQKKRFLPILLRGGLASIALTEPNAGSDATGMQTQFKRIGNEIEINGSKIFITSGDVADLVVLFGKWSELGQGRDAISIVVVEKGTPGFEVIRTEHKMGIKSSSTAALAFDGCRVPMQNLVGAPGQGLSMLFQFLNKSRPSVAAHALGIARAAFEDSIQYVNERKQSGRRILENQGIQFLIGDLASELALCESWLWQVGRMIDKGYEGIGQASSILKLRASDLAMRITTDAVQLYGGYGYTQDYRVERLMRDAKITQIWEGTNQIHRQLIGKGFLSKSSS